MEAELFFNDVDTQGGFVCSFSDILDEFLANLIYNVFERNKNH